jgi:hypothetical protein
MKGMPIYYRHSVGIFIRSAFVLGISYRFATGRRLKGFSSMQTRRPLSRCQHGKQNKLRWISIAEPKPQKMYQCLNFGIYVYAKEGVDE